MRYLLLCLTLCLHPARAEPRLLLKAEVAKGQVEVFVNDQAVGKFGSEDIFTTARADDSGQNQLRCVWKGKRAPPGDIHISYAEDGVKYRELAAMDFGVMSRPSGDQKTDFLMPGSAVSGKPQARPGSQAGQTLLTCNLTRGKVLVSVNGRKVGSYVAGLVPLDVSNHVHSGQNSLNVIWDEKSRIPLGSIRISYAQKKNQFRKIAEHDLSVFTQKRSGAHNAVPFLLP